MTSTLALVAGIALALPTLLLFAGAAVSPLFLAWAAPAGVGERC